MTNNRDLTELFGYSPTDTSIEARSLWNIGACPFTNTKCIKHNHDQSIIYGTCSVHSFEKDVIICPYRLYAENYSSLRRVAKDAFGDNLPFYLFKEYVEKRAEPQTCIVALGQTSGWEVKIGNSMSMDWILAKINRGVLEEYIGVEVQSIDITGNYRDAWHAYKNYKAGSSEVIPSSAHGYNWANVHKRIIPQLIRKGLMLSRSKYVKRGLYFIAPDVVYQKFEDILGDLSPIKSATNETITVQTYSLGMEKGAAQHRDLVFNRQLRFTLKEFSEKFVSGPNLPTPEILDGIIIKMLTVR